MKSYNEMTEEELLRISMNTGLHDEDANKEWVRRFELPVPYKLTYDGKILNCASELPVPDEECDRLVLKQVNRVRETEPEPKEEDND